MYRTSAGVRDGSRTPRTYPGSRGGRRQPAPCRSRAANGGSRSSSPRPTRRAWRRQLPPRTRRRQALPQHCPPRTPDKSSCTARPSWQSWSLPAPMPEIIAHYGGLRVLVPTASPPGITRAWSRHRNVPLTSQVHLFSARPYRPGQGPITSAVDTNRWRPGFFSQRLSPAAPSDLGMPRLTLPEKRKVGGSTPPLTTSQLATHGPVARLNVFCCWICSAPQVTVAARSRPSFAVCWGTRSARHMILSMRTPGGGGHSWSLM